MTWESNDCANWLESHGPALLLFARQFVPSHSDAEDILQDSFVRFWRSRERATDPVAYLFSCVRHASLDWRRGHRRRTRRELAVARPEQSPLFEGEPQQNERRTLIEAAIRSLPELQREVLVLKIWGGLSFPQIAETLQISANTAASRYRYGLSKLRSQLTEELVP